jgi:tungstate transport system permease protein
MLRITTTLMGLPPVVAGLAVFLLLSRSGPLGSLRLLFSVEAMIIAQVVLITPIVAGLTAAVTEMRFKQVSETVLGLGMSRTRALLMTLTECRSQMVGIILTGFGRAISEVGAVSIVGGNIQYQTRVMTTSIMMVTNMGRFEMAIALGAVLLFIAFAVNIAAGTLSGETP